DPGLHENVRRPVVHLVFELLNQFVCHHRIAAQYIADYRIQWIGARVGNQQIAAPYRRSRSGQDRIVIAAGHAHHLAAHRPDPLSAWLTCSGGQVDDRSRARAPRRRGHRQTMVSVARAHKRWKWRVTRLARQQVANRLDTTCERERPKAGGHATEYLEVSKRSIELDLGKHTPDSAAARERGQFQQARGMVVVPQVLWAKVVQR